MDELTRALKSRNVDVWMIGEVIAGQGIVIA
jgi:hypothetical protein